MRYDPFASSEGPDANASVKGTLVSVRRPQIAEVRLQPLEWDKPDTSARKRAKPDGHAHKEDANDRTRNLPTENNHVKEVVRVVEKVVNTENTILGVAPLVDDRVRHVVNFILDHVKSPHVEVEAKLGTLMEKMENVRAVEVVPILCETPIRSESNKDTRFESDVGANVFSALNSKLNKRVEETAEQETGRVHYQRTRERDVYWTGRVRQTQERKVKDDGSEYYETIRVQTKTRLGDLNVLCPNRIADIRYSASMEMDCTVPADAKMQMQRFKDRISYKFEYLSVDITCVEMQEGGKSKTTFEVEVEIDAVADLYGEVEKYRRGDETSKLFDIAQSMVNTVRLLLEP